MEEVPRRTSLVPLAFPCFLHCLIGVETEGLLDYQGRAGDHVYCTVEPSPGHIRRRKNILGELFLKYFQAGGGVHAHGLNGCRRVRLQGSF